MSWTSVFPVLSEEMVQEYSASATKEERAELDGWFSVHEVINPRPEPHHLVSFSLFWKNRDSADPELPKLDRRTLKNARQRNLVVKHEPWSHYVEPLLDAAALILKGRRDVSFRVYLAADMQFLVKDLVKAGCEVFLMKSSSVRHNPGAMWRFLALEEKGRLVTIADSDRAPRIEADLLRTAECEKAGLGMWRVPVWGDFGSAGEVVYRPMFGGQFGGSQRVPMGRLMKAFVWQARRGAIAGTCQIPACGERPIKGAAWPDYGFDEYFLIAAVYPRLAMKGVLSFIPTNARGQLLLLDIEYATWANPRSEVVYFAANGAACCAPGGAGPAGLTNGKSTATLPREVGLKAPGDFAMLPTESLTQRHRLPPFARRAQPLREDITGRVWAWFNAASILWKGKRWLAYRTECSPLWHWTRTSLVQLDAEFRPIAGTNRILDLPTDFGRWGAEDPRFTLWDDRLFLSYCDGYRAGIAEIADDGSLHRATLLSQKVIVEGVTAGKDWREKNWGPFPGPDGLLVAYWVNPHVVIEFDAHTRTLGRHFAVPWTVPVETTVMHGSSPPVLHDGLYWRVVHSAPGVGNGIRCYRLWLMAFEAAPPYTPVWFCTVPLVIAEPEQATRPEPVVHHVVFCGSLERVENGWLLFFGENDVRIRYGVIEYALIASHLVRVGSPGPVLAGPSDGDFQKTGPISTAHAPSISLRRSKDGTEADPRIPFFWGGIGDIFLQCCTSDQYRILSDPDPPAIIVNTSSNEFSDEYFRWHPNADRFRVIRATRPPGVNVNDPEFFASLGLPGTGMYRRKHVVDWDTQFFPSPADAPGLAWEEQRRYGLFAPYSKEHKTLPEKIVLELLSRLQEVLAGSGQELFGIGRNYRTLNQQVQSFEEYARKGWLTDLTPYDFSVPGAIEVARRAALYVGANSCLALVTMSRGIPTVIIEPDNLINAKSWPRLFNLPHCLLLQKFSSFDVEAVVAFLAERLAQPMQKIAIDHPPKA